MELIGITQLELYLMDNRLIQFVDLWIELNDLTIMNFLEPIYSIFCSNIVTYQRNIPNFILFILLVVNT